MSNDLVFTVEFNVKPESREVFLASLDQVVENMAREDTFFSSYRIRMLMIQISF